MTREELIEALLRYGDHRARCAITKLLVERREAELLGFPAPLREYPPCTCGWQATYDRLLPSGKKN